jgi:hypothetical protein
MGDAVNAISYKADVKSRVQDTISQKKDAVSSRASGLVSRVAGKAPSSGEMKAQGQQAVSIAQSNPLGLAIGAVAVGFLAGLVIPSSQMEHEKLGEASDQVKAKALETGQEALERGKQVAQDVAQSAAQTAQESGQQHAQEFQESAQSNAQEAAEGAQSRTSSRDGGAALGGRQLCRAGPSPVRGPFLHVKVAGGRSGIALPAVRGI